MKNNLKKLSYRIWSSDMLTEKFTIMKVKVKKIKFNLLNLFNYNLFNFNTKHFVVYGVLKNTKLLPKANNNNYYTHNYNVVIIVIVVSVLFFLKICESLLRHR